MKNIRIFKESNIEKNKSFKNRIKSNAYETRHNLSIKAEKENLKLCLTMLFLLFMACFIYKILKL